MTIAFVLALMVMVMAVHARVLHVAWERIAALEAGHAVIETQVKTVSRSDRAHGGRAKLHALRSKRENKARYKREAEAAAAALKQEHGE